MHLLVLRNIYANLQVLLTAIVKQSAKVLGPLVFFLTESTIPGNCYMSSGHNPEAWWVPSVLLLGWVNLTETSCLRLDIGWEGPTEAGFGWISASGLVHFENRHFFFPNPPTTTGRPETLEHVTVSLPVGPLRPVVLGFGSGFSGDSIFLYNVFLDPSDCLSSGRTTFYFLFTDTCCGRVTFLPKKKKTKEKEKKKNDPPPKKKTKTKQNNNNNNNNNKAKKKTSCNAERSIQSLSHFNDISETFCCIVLLIISTECMLRPTAL